MPVPISLTSSQVSAIEITERVCSILSLLGAAFVISTFIFDKSFHKPINRLVFYAAWGNVLANLATLISVSGIHLGVDGALCQFQAFLIQWFMPADALWTFAMACNVYLTFFQKYDAHQLRLLEWRYVLLCYGIPFIPALAYCFIRTDARGRIYGSAVLWCWVSIDWDFLRIATFYGPVWLVILATFTIYLTVGRVVLKWRRQLSSFPQSVSSATDTRARCKTQGITRTTEVFITTEPVAQFPQDTPRQLSFQESWNSTLRDDQSQLSPRSKGPSQFRSQPLSTSAGNMDGNTAAVKYCKCALLFFIALLVTWVPSTINRVYTLVQPKETLFGLDYASGMVLPLQGFWNAIIYIATSSAACQALMRSVGTTASRFFAAEWVLKRRQSGRSTTPVDFRGNTGRRNRRIDAHDSGSMQELRTARNETM